MKLLIGQLSNDFWACENVKTAAIPHFKEIFLLKPLDLSWNSTLVDFHFNHFILNPLWYDGVSLFINTYETDYISKISNISENQLFFLKITDIV